MKEDLVVRFKKLAQHAAEELDKKAKEMLSLAIQRCAVSHATESTTSVIDLPSDEMKGRIIGREGRNIRAIERLTGTEIIVDDTPQAITVSGFSPIRRQVAKKRPGKTDPRRPHPSGQDRRSDRERQKRDGHRDQERPAKIPSTNSASPASIPKLVQIIGRLKYRTSYGQNILQHSIEIAHLSALLAEELGRGCDHRQKRRLAPRYRQGR